MSKYWKYDRTRTMGDLARAGRHTKISILVFIAIFALVTWLLLP